MSQNLLTKNYTVSVVVSALNEASTIKGVLQATLDCSLTTEVVVVDDGSTDDTWNIIQQVQKQYPHKLHSIRFEHNKGKSYAMVAGVRKTTGSIILFMDADLVNVGSKHIKALVSPLVNDGVDMTLGYMKTRGASRVYKIFKSISGQRAVFRSNIMPILDKIEDSKYGVEILLNLHHIKNNLVIEYIHLKGMEHVSKQQKTRDYMGVTKGYYGEAKDIAKVLLLEREDVKHILSARAEEFATVFPNVADDFVAGFKLSLKEGSTYKNLRS